MPSFGSHSRGILLIAVALAFVASCRRQQPVPAPTHVRVAAIQYYSRMGDTDYNTTMMTALAKAAASGGAKIIVFPECAFTGYTEQGYDVVWTTNADETDACLS